MSVYVGINVHRKRSQVAVIGQSGEVLANRNVPNGVEPILGVIGGLPTGTPAAFEAAFGWGWLVELPDPARIAGVNLGIIHPYARPASSPATATSLRRPASPPARAAEPRRSSRPGVTHRHRPARASPTWAGPGVARHLARSLGTARNHRQVH